jgi:hypothetical protein
MRASAEKRRLAMLASAKRWRFRGTHLRTYMSSETNTVGSIDDKDVLAANVPALRSQSMAREVVDATSVLALSSHSMVADVKVATYRYGRRTVMTAPTRKYVPNAPRMHASAGKVGLGRQMMASAPYPSVRAARSRA